MIIQITHGAIINVLHYEAGYILEVEDRLGTELIRQNQARQITAAQVDGLLLPDHHLMVLTPGEQPVLSMIGVAVDSDDGEGSIIFGGPSNALLLIVWDVDCDALIGSKVKVKYSEDSGEEWHEMATDLLYDDGGYAWAGWATFNTATEGFYVRVISLKDTAVLCTSIGYATVEYTPG